MDKKCKIIFVIEINHLYLQGYRKWSTLVRMNEVLLWNLNTN